MLVIYGYWNLAAHVAVYPALSKILIFLIEEDCTAEAQWSASLDCGIISTGGGVSREGG